MKCSTCGSERVIILNNLRIQEYFEGRKEILVFCEYCKTTEVKK